MILMLNINNYVFCLRKMLCEIWYYLYNLKNLRNTHRGVSLLVMLQAVPLLHLLKTSEKMLEVEVGSSLRDSSLRDLRVLGGLGVTGLGLTLRSCHFHQTKN